MGKPAKPAALEVEGVPPIPATLGDEVRPYLEARHALVAGWRASDRALLILTRFADTPQLHAVAVPLGSRLRGVAEARWQGLFGDSTGPTWFVPITVGLRY